MPKFAKQAVALLLCVLLGLSPLSAAAARAEDAEEPSPAVLSAPEAEPALSEEPAEAEAEAPEPESESEHEPEPESEPEPEPAPDPDPDPVPEPAAEAGDGAPAEPEAAEGPALAAETPAAQEPEEEFFYDLCLNPLYAGHIREADLVAEAPAAGRKAAKSGSFGTQEEAALRMRALLEQREAAITVCYHTDSSSTTGVAAAIAALAMEHTGVPTQGDYLQYHYAGWHSTGKKAVDPNGGYNLTITYTFTYYTSAAQELEVDGAVSAALAVIAPEGKGEAARIKSVYDYVTANVRYDYAHLSDESYLLKYSAYAALINRSAVCQGYAVLVYRLLLSCGVDCRVIPGVTDAGEGHAWNIVRLGDLYYNADATWDAGLSSYKWFLLGESFARHTRDADYAGGAFAAAYPMSGEAYPGYLASWVWAEDLQSASLSVVCIDDSSETLPAALDIQRTEPDCTADGQVVYTAAVTYRDRDYTDVRQVLLPAPGHSFTYHPGEAGDYEAARDGLAEYWACGVCMRFYADEAGQHELHEEDLVIHWESLADYPAHLRLDNSPARLLAEWRPVTGAQRYQIIRSAGGGNWVSLSTTLTEPAYADGDVSMGTAYRYRVRALVDGSWRSYCEPVTLVYNPYSDVAESDSSFSRVAWAYNAGLLSAGGGQFHPNEGCTRGQFAVLLYKLAGRPSVKGMKMPFTDVSGSLYTRAVTWAYNQKIVSGTSATTFSPDAGVTRYQAVLMLWKMAGRPKVSAANPFTDVSKSAGYYNAVMWAVKNKITTGTSAATFSPNAGCTRAQLVTFLFKFNKLMKYV